jgi:putative ABC transport system permease protein
MPVRPILSAMRRNKVGAILIALQMALTLAILCNALFIIHQRLHNSERPTGVDEDNVFVMLNEWIGDTQDIKSLQQADLAALRQLPGVVDAYPTNSYPLSGGGWSTGADLALGQKHATAHTTDYFADDHAQDALGLRLSAGRWFNASEVVDRGENDEKPPSNALIVTRALADKLFPDGTALGKTIYVDDTAQTIVGIVEHLQTPWVSSSWAEGFIENALLQPNRIIAQRYYYIVRTRPGQIGTVPAAAQKALLALDKERVIRNVRTFAEVRAKAYRDDRGFAIILATVCAILIAVTAFGIVGLTSFWVTQRRRQIGIRRALGATRRAIVHHFQTENLIIAVAAAAVGAGLAIGLNIWMVSKFEMLRMPVAVVIGGAAAVLGLGQIAVLWPALRASSIPPALATRAA